MKVELHFLLDGQILKKVIGEGNMQIWIGLLLLSFSQTPFKNYRTPLSGTWLLFQFLVKCAVFEVSFILIYWVLNWNLHNYTILVIFNYKKCPYIALEKRQLTKRCQKCIYFETWCGCLKKNEECMLNFSLLQVCDNLG